MMPSMWGLISICLTHFVKSSTWKANVSAELAQRLGRQGVICGMLRSGVLCDTLGLECKLMRRNFLEFGSAARCQFPFCCTGRENGSWVCLSVFLFPGSE